MKLADSGLPKNIIKLIKIYKLPIRKVAMTTIKNSNEVYDAIVIGSGISGGWAAKELTEKGLKTLMIERGRDVIHQQDYISEGVPSWKLPHRGRVEKELIDERYAIQQKCYAFNDTTKHFFADDKDIPYHTPEDKPFTWIRGNQVGGKSLIWGRQCYRLSELDFSANASDGYGNDWPLRYNDLKDWYSYVEHFAGISGTSESLSQLPDSEFQPGFELNCVEKAVKQRIEKSFKGRKLIIGRAAHLTKPTEEQVNLGRGTCLARSECEKGCSFGAYFSTQSATLPAAKKTGLLSIATDSIVHSIIYDDKTNRAVGVHIIDRITHKTREYYAKVIFVCASTLGSTQILLNSKSAAFPNGIGNSSGVLGHYLMDHISGAGAKGIFPGMLDKYYYGRRPTGIYIPRFRNLSNQDDGFLRGFGYEGEAKREGWADLTGQQGIGKNYKNTISKGGRWKFILSGFGEMLPDYDNSVSLHDNKKDKWGMPILTINCQHGENEHKMLEDMADSAAEMLEVAGLVEVKKIQDSAPPGLMIHEMGTARMGKDPENSYLNGLNQSHDVPNLFVTDGASMCSIASQNPSLTFMALTARACNYAAKLIKSKVI